MLIAASKGTFKLAESRNAMNTIRRYAADDAHVIYGTAYDETLGDQLRVTVIATGLSSVARKNDQRPDLRTDQRGHAPLQVVQQQQPIHHHGQSLRTGTDNLPILNQLAQSAAMGGNSGNGGHGGNAGNGHANMAQPSYDSMNTPSVWRTNRTHAAAKVDALASNGMDEIEIPAFLRKQAD